MILDLFAGPGGWDEGAAQLGLKTVGIEWDDAACRTAMAAGHTRVRADVSTIATAPMVGKVTGLIASPPCQAWSMAGKRKGELDRADCHTYADRMAAGDDSTDWTFWEDYRSPLVCEPVRFVRDLRPEWVALEEVPAVASLWEHFALIFRRWGYSVWTGDLNSADYGVPQTRVRRILMASRTTAVQPPPPTHAQDPADDLFGGSTLPWVTMAQALGWGMTERPYFTVASGAQPGSGADVALLGGSGARKNLRRELAEGRWVVDRRTNSRGPRGTTEPTVTVPLSEPAPTFTGKSGHQWVIREADWPYERPATTVVGSFKPEVISPPGYRLQESRQNAEGGVKVTVAEGGVKVTVAEGGVLQSFRRDYPWFGTKTKQYQQVGNAIPPLLARHILASLLGVAATEAAA